MDEVPGELVARIQDTQYTEPYRFMVAAEAEFPRMKAEFLVNSVPYTGGIMNHLPTPIAQQCIFQLSYVAFAHWTLERRFENIELSLDEFIGFMDNDMLLYDSHTHVNFRNEIPLRKPFSMAGHLTKFRCLRKRYFTEMEIDIGEGRASAHSKLTFKAPR